MTSVARTCWGMLQSVMRQMINVLGSLWHAQQLLFSYLYCKLIDYRWNRSVVYFASRSCEWTNNRAGSSQKTRIHRRHLNDIREVIRLSNKIMLSNVKMVKTFGSWTFKKTKLLHNQGFCTILFCTKRLWFLTKFLLLQLRELLNNWDFNFNIEFVVRPLITRQFSVPVSYTHLTLPTNWEV